MKFDLRNFSLKTLLYFAFGLLAIISFTHFLFTTHINSQVASRGQSVELVNELSKNTYAMMSVSPMASDAHWPEKRSELKNIVGRHQNQLYTLEFGGKFNYHRIDAASDELLKSLKKSNIQWLPLKANISVLLDGEIEVDSLYLKSTNGLIAGNAAGAIKLINNQARNYILSLENLADDVKFELNQFQERLNSIALIFFMIEMLILILLVVTILNYVIGPLSKLSTVTDKMGHGESDIIRTTYKNEIEVVQEALNRFSIKLQNVTDFVKEIGSGNLKAEISGFEDQAVSNGLEGALVAMRDEMLKVSEDETQRKWATEGLAQFVEILRATDSDVKELGDKIISKLVEYTNSNQGGIYLYNDDEESPVLELIALYAFSNKKYEERTIRVGEGLVGQTFLERKTTYLLEIPNDYIDIVSGLGGANPKAILIVPLIVNDNIYGILEIASFKEYEQHEIDFIEKLCESIASTISGVKINQRTKQLLEESQQLTEQMQAQEEEMRQNMEELTATQEEMARGENERFAQQSAIDENIGIAEFNSTGDLIYSNDEYNRQLGLSTEKAQSLNMLSLFGKVIDNEFEGYIDKTSGSHSMNTYSIFRRSEIDGEQKTVELSLKTGEIPSNEIHVNDLGEMLQIQLEALDITQAKLDESLKVYVEKAKALSGSSYVLTLNDQLQVKNINQKAAAFVSKAGKEIVGKNVKEVFKAFQNKSGRQYLETYEGDTIEADVFIASLADEHEYLVHWN
ncbi:MAG: GAF domain-containing protein [Bacteroidota bacterium]